MLTQIHTVRMLDEARSQCLSLPSTVSNHSHLATARTRRLWRRQTLFPGDPSTCPKDNGCSHVGPFVVSVVLVGFEKYVVTTVVMVFVSQDVAKIIDTLSN